jgi:hypothetical protein
MQDDPQLRSFLCKGRQGELLLDEAVYRIEEGFAVDE